MSLLSGGGCRRTPTLQQDGGVRLVYAVDFDAVNELGNSRRRVNSTKQLPDVPEAILRRLKPYRGTTARAISETEFEIIVPGVGDTAEADIKNLIAGHGMLRFMIIANPHDHAELIEQARASDDAVVVMDGEKAGRWVNVGYEPTKAGKPDFRAIGAGDVLRGHRDGDNYEPVEFDDVVLRRIAANELNLAEATAALGFRDVQVLAVVEPRGMNIAGWHIKTATKSYDGTLKPAVNFTMSESGAILLERLTTDNLPDQNRDIWRRLGIVLDGKVISAPRLMSTIARDGQITGNFTDAEVDEIVAIIRYGRKPVLLKPEPVSEEWFPSP